MSQQLEKDLLLILLAGEIMLKNGAETYRVEDTMEWIGKKLGVTAEGFVTPTGIFITVEDANNNSATRVLRINTRGFDLAKVSAVNDFSRNFSPERCSREEAMAYLQEIDARPEYYPTWLVMLAAGIASAGFAYLYGGGLYDYLPAFIAGAFAQFALRYFVLRRMIRFTSSFFGGLVVGLVGIFLGKLYPVVNVDKVIIGAIMPLVPGVAITNAARDLVSDHLLSGLARIGEALMVAAAIAAGVAIVMFL